MNLQPPEVSVVIVNWNSKDYLRQCLDSLERYCTSIAYEVIVADCASFDGCGEMLAADFPSASFIQIPTNVGFAKANNLAATHAKGCFLLLLNPDTEFRDNALRVMLDTFAVLPQAGALGGKLLNPDGSVQTTSVLAYPTILNQVFDSDFLRRKFRHWSMWGSAPLYAEPPTIIDVEALSGACILIRRELYNQVAGLSEEYFMYSEDVDLGYKVRQAGRPCYYVPFASVIHYGGGSSDRAPSNFSAVMMRESTHRFLRLHRGTIYALLFRTTLGVSALGRCMATVLPLLVKHSEMIRDPRGSLRKWWAIFRWSIGLEGWARTFPDKG